ncbi:MAG: ABC transporter ATP-binding protein [Pseudotabrizicola sp.]|uniref:ABC transporter ATP-binding protein n=1 Tax=Pseudotabrizicola sp. TaxID=2939647 RepID=UPI0027265A68|nr:ABC transporter ATP-binding protein [Pseudotabrizicola sp.]MDO8884701.1 ABC transporter ATP-binding protein [Pseudotabrizicola sp.]MDP2082551.1 ABC transporter ATP-binding protein [Pseudotabrizicola sp.]MDZ7573938.1 ABC transporter ATP-binding protein [Pseudotabrizicola sp.]
MSFLTMTNLEKLFGQNRVVKDFSLSVEKGEFISLLGPSGCGKTTVLRMVAGFESPTAGGITIDGKDVTGLKANSRNIGMMFQAYALFPNMTVADNVAFGLKVKGAPRAERDARVAEMLALIGLEDLGARFPFQLSGGQQQRVALARALAPRPSVLLLDEPLSALDAKVRVSLRNQIRQIQQDLGITTIFVTHDQEEAMSISDRIVVMNGGVADQVGAPFEIYNRPRTKFVANFVGTLNTFEVEVTDPTTGRVTLAGQGLSLPNAPLAAHVGEKLSVALRPEALRLGRLPDAEALLTAKVTDVNFMGSVIRLKADLAGAAVSLDTFNRPDTPPPVVGSEVEVSLSGRDFILLQA